MAYKVFITPAAQHRLDMYIGYTATVLKNRQAARAIRDDARKTRRRLAGSADIFALLENEILAEYGYRKISFEKHDFFMVYRIDGDVAIVDGMYHELQDYESIFIREMKWGEQR